MEGVSPAGALDIGPGYTLGRYELLGTLGKGGMATVYLARTAGEAGFQRLFAVKVLHPHLANESGVQMLLDEARLAARLHHPNVVPIVDLGAQHALRYVVMEYVEGCSLLALLKKFRNERPPRMFVPLVLDALVGLDAAHSLTDDDGSSMHLVHRDVSPQNVLVGIDGTARITDFGVARAESRVNTTRPGVMKGTFAYMAPEQVRTTDIDGRSDVFAVGAMLWMTLTGRKLFQAENDAATIMNIMELEVPPPSTIGLCPPPVFDAICLRALQRDPAKRFASAREMEETLREAATSVCTLATRREISEWVATAFKDQLAARRQAIRAVLAGQPITEHVSVSQLTSRPSSTLPAMTPAGSSAGLRASSTLPVPTFQEPSTEVAPPDPEITITHAAPARRKRWIAIVAGAAALGVAVVGWLAFRSPHDEATHATTEPPAAPQTSPPANPAPSTAPVAHEVAPPARDSSPTKPDPVKPVVVTRPPARVSRPPATASRNVPPARQPTRQPARPAEPVPVPVPVPATTTKDSPTPPKDKGSATPRWDKDSPVPPP